MSAITFSDSDIRRALRGHEVAGGEGYTPDIHPSDADREVSSLSGLRTALSSSAEVIAIANDAEINISQQHMNLNLGSKTLVSYRGWDGRDGGLLYSTRQGYVGSRPFTPMYSQGGSPEIHGLRIRGAAHNRSAWYPVPSRGGNYRDTLSRAIMLRGPGGRVSNCEIWGWNWNGVHAKGRSGTLTRLEVDHCHLWRSKQLGYGYGVDIWRGFGDIHHNYFNDQRHALDGFGHWNTGYDCYNNIFGPDQNSHTVDMHCLNENGGSGPQTNSSHREWRLRAGGRMDIHDNQFCFEESMCAIAIRGVPYEHCSIDDNFFGHRRRPPENSANSHSNYAWRQVNVKSRSFGSISLDSRGFTSNFRDSGNQFGVSSLQLDALGESETTQQSHRLATQITNRPGKAAACRGMSESLSD